MNAFLAAGANRASLWHHPKPFHSATIILLLPMIYFARRFQPFS